MRIIGGKYRGKRIVANIKTKARPTTDFAKESLFNILENRMDLQSASVLDLFCGLGGVTHEFASREVRALYAVDVDPVHVRFIKNSLDKLQLPYNRILRMDAMKFIDICTEKFDLIFADPPHNLYEKTDLAQLILDRQLLTPDGLLVVEHDKNSDFSEKPTFVEMRKYGNVRFSIFKPLV